jgi:small-conductance mechanosensitive channel
VPVSKSKRRRGGRRRPPPAVQTRPRKRRTPKYVPYAFFIFAGAGVVLILLTYIFWAGRPLTLFTGLGLIGLAFAVATQWY